MKRRIAFLATCLGWPAVCQASDPTGLFILLFGIPSLLLSIVFAAIAWKAPRAGAVLCGMLLLSELPLIFWANRVGYMAGAGSWLSFSFAIAVIGLFIAFNGMIGTKKKPDATEGEK